MKIEILFSEIANLFGDMANIDYLVKCIPDAEFIYTSLNDKHKFITEDISLVYMGPMSENSQKLVIDALKPFKKDIEASINNNVNFLITGNALEVFGKYILNEDGTLEEGLGIFDIYAKRCMMHRYNSIELGMFNDIKIVGFKSSFTEVYGDVDKFIDSLPFTVAMLSTTNVSLSLAYTLGKSISSIVPYRSSMLTTAISLLTRLLSFLLSLFNCIHLSRHFYTVVQHIQSLYNCEYDYSCYDRTSAVAYKWQSNTRRWDEFRSSAYTYKYLEHHYYSKSECTQFIKLFFHLQSYIYKHYKAAYIN